MVPALTAHLGFWLRQVSNHVTHTFAAALDAKGVTVAEWVVMRSLYGRPPMSPSHLADEIGMTRGAITKLADRLIAKSLILRMPSAQDGRSHTLMLTDTGSALLPDLAAIADRNDAACFAVLSEDERKTLERLLKAVVAGRGLTALPIS